MATEKAQGKLHRLSLVCKIGSAGASEGGSASKEQVGPASKRAKGIVVPRAEGRKLILSNEQTKTDIIKYPETTMRRYDCFDQIITEAASLTELFTGKDRSVAQQLLQGVSTGLILFGLQGYPNI